MTRSCAHPDIIPSAAAAATAPEEEPSSFSEIEYQALHQRYLEKRTRTGMDAALSSGIRLRRKTVKPAICIDTPGYKALKKQIDGLERKNDHQEIFRLLSKLSEWEKSVNRPFPFATHDELDQDDDEKPVEIIDLADDQDVIDIDTYILDVLLVKVIKAEDTEHTSTTNVKQEEGDDLPREAQESKSSEQGVKVTR
jgi:hypothetical protein